MIRMVPFSRKHNLWSVAVWPSGVLECRAGFCCNVALFESAVQHSNMLQLGGGGGDLHLFSKMLTNPKSLMHHNLENCFGTFVEICRNILSSLRALISKTSQQKRHRE